MKFLRIMGGCFFLAGAAVFVLAPILRVMGGVWIGVGIVLIGVAQMAASAAANRERLLATGKPGRATVLDVSDTGVTINNSPRVRLKVRIDVAGSPPIEATNAMLFSRVSIPRAGEVYDVRFDAQDPNNFTIAPSSSSHRQVFAEAAIRNDTLGQLERLTALRDKGALTPDEFETQKRKLLGED